VALNSWNMLPTKSTKISTQRNQVNPQYVVLNDDITIKVTLR